MNIYHFSPNRQLSIPYTLGFCGLVAELRLLIGSEADL
jgi:hypothetical protein